MKLRKLHPELLKSKVARRILTLFVLCALIPISSLALITFRQVTEQLETQSRKRLHESCKALGVSIFERLTFLENELKILATVIGSSPGSCMPPAADGHYQNLGKRFKGLGVYRDSAPVQPLLGIPPQPIALSEAQGRHLRTGKALVLTCPDEDGENGYSILMVRALDVSDLGRGLLVAQIHAPYLWGLSEYNTLPSMTELCILDESENVIFSTLPAKASLDRALRSETNQSTSGSFDLKYGDDKYIASFRSVPLKFNFFVPGWKIILTQRKEYIFSSLVHFKTIFPAIILLSLFVVFLLSLIQIRKTMIPLEKLRDGARRIGSGEFDAVVHVESDDEFEEVAESFNTMTKQLGDQFAALKTMAEIDRAILSSLDRRKIVETVLSRVRAFLPCDYVTFSLFEFDSIASGQNYIGKKTPNRPYLAEPFHLTSEERKELPNDPDIQLVEMELARAPYRGPLENQGAKWILVLPIMFEQRLLGIIALGYLQRPQQSQEDERRARQFADQVAVAMANAHLIEARERAERALQQVNAELEQRVKDRTSELTSANENLRREVRTRKRTELQLQEAKNVAEMANRIKSDFLANMSHELRTPLNAIIGFNEMLVDKKLGDLTELQLDMLKDMLESSYHLLSLINDILDLSKVEAGKLELSTTETNLEDLLSRSLVIVKEKAVKDNIKLNIDAKNLPATIEADERKLKQVIYNLLSNALKFTPEGGSVSLKARNLLLVNGHFETPEGERFDLEDIKEDLKETQNTKFLMISVEDTGIGIKLEDQARVFNPFEQVESSMSRKYQGTGLGLPLTKKLIELHGGRIWLESPGEGRGSTFTFVIPT